MDNIDYTIALDFILWVIALLLCSGFGMIKLVEFDLNNPDSNTDDKEKMGLELIINEFREGNFAKRLMLVIEIGGILFSLLMHSLFGKLVRYKDK